MRKNLAGRHRGKRHELAVLIIIIVIVAGMILPSGCVQQESSKTMVLPTDTEGSGSRPGINIKNIKEHTYEGNVLSMAWKEGDPGKICVFCESGSGICQTIDVYQKETEETVMEDFFVGMAKISPGGKYIMYEIMEDSYVQLVLFRTETKEKQVIREWEDLSEVYMYEWSGDGTKFFAWQDGNNYGQDLYGNWSICRYDAESGERAEILMEGNGCALRSVLPSEDGSKAYVREEYMDEYGNAMITADSEAEESYGNVRENYAFDASEDEQTIANRNWVVDIAAGEVKELDEEKMGVSNPIRYTRQGVFGREGDEIWLVPEPLGETEKRRILTTDCEEICICENGDHIFLTDWSADPDYLQVTGVRMQDGEVMGRQILYKNIYGIYDTVLVGRNDSELIIQTEEYLDSKECLMRVAVLEY